MGRTGVSICTSLLLALSGSLQAATIPDQVEFNFKYKPGYSFTQKISTKQVGSMKLPVPLGEQKMSQSIEQTMSSRCTKVNPDGSGEFECKFDAISARMTFGGLNITFDSRKYDPNAKSDMVSGLVSRIFNAMAGIKFGMTLSPTGQVLKVHGFDDVLKRLSESFGADDKEGQAFKAVLDQIGKSMDDGTMSQELQAFSRMVPPKPGGYKVGDKWKKEWKTSIMGMSIDGQGDYELVGIEDYRGHLCAKIRTKETAAIGAAPATPTTNPFAALMAKMNIKMNSSGGGGYAFIDINSGVLVHMIGTQNMAMSFEVKPEIAGGKSTPGTSFSQTMRISTAADLVEPGIGDGADSLSSGSSNSTSQPQ